MIQDLINEITDLKLGTYRFRKFLENLSTGFLNAEEVFDNSIAYTAIQSTIQEAQIYLKTQLEDAIKSTQEFDYPEFSSRLIEAFSKDGIISLSNVGGIKRFIVNAEDYAGTPEDYANAVKFTRSTFPNARMTKSSGQPKPQWGLSGFSSYFWREYLYKPAREGKQIANVGKGQTIQKTLREGKKVPKSMYNKTRTKILIEQYRRTIETRIQRMTTIAPYWYILNYGSAAFKTGRWQGEPYPVIPATRFVEKTEAYAKSLYDEYYTYAAESVYNDFMREIENFARNPVEYQPGAQLYKVRQNAMDYKIYVTSRGRVGIRKMRYT